MAGEGPTGLTWLEPERLGEVVARWRVQHPGGTVVELRGERAADRPGLFDEAATALSLPSWFGRNWDALYDALTDLSWLARPACLLVVSDAEQLLRDRPDELQALLGVLAEAAAWWDQKSAPAAFASLLVTASGTAS